MMNSDGLDDYLVLDPKTGQIKAFLNEGKDDGSQRGWKFKSIGQIASGLGPGHRVRIADIDGDGVSQEHECFRLTGNISMSEIFFF